jgi:hypothetical protein
LKNSINFFRDSFDWDQTIFILGLPRSGKSSLLKIIGSYRDFEFSEEPFDATLLALKSSNYKLGSPVYNDLHDGYLAVLEHIYSECKLGRNYNFRNIDQSYILNFKSDKDISISHSISRRKDLLKLLENKNKKQSLVLVLNDMEFSLPFITNKVPSPVIVFVKRDVFEVASEIANKGWLSDNSLSTQADLTPAFRNVFTFGEKRLYVPHFINKEEAALFYSLDQFNRSLMYAALQSNNYNNFLNNYSGRVIEISFEDIFINPLLLSSHLEKELEASPGDKTLNNISNLAKNFNNDIPSDHVLDNNLIVYLKSRQIGLKQI